MNVELLQNLKKLLTTFTLSRDIEDIVFDYNGQKLRNPNDCHGKQIITNYNTQARTENINSFNYFRRKTCLEKEIFEITDTRYFSISSTKNIYGSYDSITTYYFKEVIIIETITNCRHWQPNPPNYKGFRHYFTPDILLFLKHFHQSDKTECGMDYIRQNPHYFKHHTVDSIEIFRKASETINEIIEENKIKLDYYSNLEKNIIELEQQNQTLQNKITELENSLKRSESPVKLKIE